MAIFKHIALVRVIAIANSIVSIVNKLSLLDMEVDGTGKNLATVKYIFLFSYYFFF